MEEKIFEINIDGPGVAPNTIRLSDLYEILHAFEAAVIQTAAGRSGIGQDAELHLVGIQEGSANCLLSVADSGYRAAAICAEAIRTRDLSSLPERARSGLIAISAKARAKNWTIRVSDRNGMATAEIAPETAFLSDATITGLSSLSGKLERVGNSARPTAHFILPDGSRITASVASLELAERLGELLFQFVSVEGEAKWSSANWGLVDFKITGITEYDDNTNILQTLDELAKISDGFWDDIDPDEYIAGLRSESD